MMILDKDGKPIKDDGLCPNCRQKRVVTKSCGFGAQRLICVSCGYDYGEAR